MTTTIKIRSLTSSTTDLLRAETRLQQHDKSAVIGRTFAEFRMEPDALDLLLDFIVSRTITAYGGSSAQTKRVRAVRRMLLLARGNPVSETEREQAAHVEIKHTGADREEVLDLIREMWMFSDHPAAEKLAALAGPKTPLRQWLSDTL